MNKRRPNRTRDRPVRMDQTASKLERFSALKLTHIGGPQDTLERQSTKKNRKSTCGHGGKSPNGRRQTIWKKKWIWSRKRKSKRSSCVHTRQSFGSVQAWLHRQQHSPTKKNKRIEKRNQHKKGSKFDHSDFRMMLRLMWRRLMVQKIQMVKRKVRTLTGLSEDRRVENHKQKEQRNGPRGVWTEWRSHGGHN